MSKFPSSGMNWLFLALLVSGTIAGCGSSTLQPTPAADQPTPTLTVPIELPVTIGLTGYFDDQTLALLDRQIAAFEATAPGIKVEVVSARRDADERREEFAGRLAEGDTSSDIYVLNTIWLAEFAAKGWLTPLDRQIQTHGIEMDDFLPASAEASTVGGQLLALPWTTDGGLLYYRQDLLDRYGHIPPSTWAEIESITLEVKEREGLPYGFLWQGAAYEGLTCNSLEFIWAYGGDVLDEGGNVIFDSPETKAALQQMLDLIDTGISPVQVATYRESATLAAFERGEAIFMRNWTYGWNRISSAGSSLAGRVAVAPLPVSCLGGQSLTLSPYSLYPDQAFRFMAFLASYDQQVQIAREGVQPPALETVYEDELLRGDPFFAELHAALSTARPRPQSASYLQLSETIYVQINRMLRGEQDVATTAANVQRGIDSLLH